jgi:hypothetical protein
MRGKAERPTEISEQAIKSAYFHGVFLRLNGMKLSHLSADWALRR